MIADPRYRQAMPKSRRQKAARKPTAPGKARGATLPDLQRRLTDEELQRLAQLLASDLTGTEDDAEEDLGICDISEVEGFFAALFCSPELVMPSEWMPVVAPNPEFESMEDAREFFGLVDRFYNEVGRRLARGGPFHPTCRHGKLPDGTTVPYAADWCVGFLEGVALRRASWEEALSGPLEPAIRPIRILGEVNRDNPGVPPFRKFPDEFRTVVAAIPESVAEIYGYFRGRRATRSGPLGGSIA